MTGRANIVAEMWIDPDFRELSPDAKSLWLYMLSGPHMRLSAGGICSLPWDQLKAEMKKHFNRTGSQVKEAMIEVVRAGFVAYDSRAGVMLVTNWLKYNKPQSPKNIIGWAATIMQLPESELINHWLNCLSAHCDERGASFKDAFDSRFKHLRIASEALAEINEGRAEPQLLFETKDEPGEKKMPGWALEVAKRMGERISEVSPRTLRARDYARWADPIDKIHRLDGYSKQDIRHVLEWTYDDSFWSTVILSGQNFRKHFERLLDGAHNGGRSRTADPYQQFMDGAKS